MSEDKQSKSLKQLTAEMERNYPGRFYLSFFLTFLGATTVGRAFALIVFDSPRFYDTAVFDLVFALVLTSVYYLYKRQ